VPNARELEPGAGKAGSGSIASAGRKRDAFKRIAGSRAPGAAGQGSPRADVPHALAITDLSSAKPDYSGTSPAMTSECVARLKTKTRFSRNGPHAKTIQGHGRDGIAVNQAAAPFLLLVPMHLSRCRHAAAADVLTHLLRAA